MRIGLADAGDGVDDANFEDTVANAAILRLTKETAWYYECLLALASDDKSEIGSGAGAMTGNFRRDVIADYNFADRVFLNAMAIAAHEAQVAYEGMQFRAALKAAFFDLQSARDLYRQLCVSEGVGMQARNIII